jgi:stage II sporulation protein D
MVRPIVFSIILFSVVFAGCSSTLPRNVSQQEPSIRVCIAERSRDIVLNISEGAVLQTSSKRYRLEGHEKLRCVLNDDGSIDVLMNEKKARTFKGAFRCFYRQPGSTFDFEGAIYADTLLIASDGQGLYLVNILPLEEYLRNVVPNEIGRNRKPSEEEAIKAQAILARTYALSKIALPLTRLFDVYADVRDQMFGGLSERDELTSRAVEATRGVVVTFHDQLAECYFHSTCGGSTEASSLIWKRPQSKPYLVGTSDRATENDFCRISPSYRWSERFSRGELEQILRIFLPAANDAILPEDIPDENWYLLDLNIIKRSPSGRVATLQVIMGNRSRQRAYYVHGDKIRWAIRRGDAERVLRSTLFDLVIERDSNRWIEWVRIDGGGAGHGVGMCQWGAIGRARSGSNAGEILSAFFPGTEQTRIY